MRGSIGCHLFACCGSQKRTLPCTCCSASASLPGFHTAGMGPRPPVALPSDAQPSVPCTCCNPPIHFPQCLFISGWWALLLSNAAEPCKTARGCCSLTKASPISHPRIPPSPHPASAAAPPACLLGCPPSACANAQPPAPCSPRLPRAGAPCGLPPAVRRPASAAATTCLPFSCHLVTCCVRCCLQPLDRHQLPAGAEAKCQDTDAQPPAPCLPQPPCNGRSCLQPCLQPVKLPQLLTGACAHSKSGQNRAPVAHIPRHPNTLPSAAVRALPYAYQSMSRGPVPYSTFALPARRRLQAHQSLTSTRFRHRP